MFILETFIKIKPVLTYVYAAEIHFSSRLQLFFFVTISHFHNHCYYRLLLTSCPLLQCVPQSRVCDGQKDCYNGDDEELCSKKFQRDYTSPDPPAILNINMRGDFTLHALNNSQLSAFNPAKCPPTHFQCPGQSVLLPLYVLLV